MDSTINNHLIIIIGLIFSLTSCSIEENVGASDDMSFLDEYKMLLDYRGGMYVVKENIDLNGKVWNVPDNIILDFNNYKVKNGRINLGNKKTIINGCFINDKALTYRRIIYDGRIFDYCIAVSVIDKSDVTIKNCTFYSNLDDTQIGPNENIGLMIYGTYDNGCTNISVDSCSFDGCYSGMFSKVRQSSVTSCKFVNSMRMLSVETLYNEEHDSIYINPSGIHITGNEFVTDASSVISTAPIYISGVENVVFADNYCKTNSRMMTFYCGDFNMGLKNLRIDNCIFEIGESDSSTTLVCPIDCLGRSNKYPEEAIQYKSIEFNDCSFIYSGNYFSKHNTCRCFTIRFIDDISLKKCLFEGFDESICLTDRYRGAHYESTVANIVDCKFVNTEQPVSYGVDKGNLDIRKLVFKNNRIKKNEQNINFISDLIKYANCDVSGNEYFEN